MVLRARELGIDVRVIHNASIMNAIGCTGLQLYNFGQTVSVPFWTETWTPDSFYDKIEQNAVIGLHTLCLLDIKVKEQSIENLLKCVSSTSTPLTTRGKKIFEPPRFMTVNQCVSQLLQSEENRKKNSQYHCIQWVSWLVCGPDSKAIGVARVGQDDQCIISGTLGELLNADFGRPLHSLVLCGHMHPIEDTFFESLKPK